MPIDACKVGICNIYDGGSGVFNLIVGVAIGVALVLLIQSIGKHRRRK
jgi:hypothetical protein